MTITTDLDLTLLDPVIEKYESGGRSNLLPALHDAQRIYGHLPEPVIRALGQGLRVPFSDIYGVVEFYTMFYSEPVGKRMIRI